MVVTLTDNKWKVVRTYISPSLTTGKIKGMSYQMLDCIKEWFSRVKSKSPKNEESFEFSPKP